MKKYYLAALTLFLFTGFIVSCSDSDDEEYIPVSPVVVDLTQVPYSKLSEYHFFDGDMKNQNPSLNVIPYEPASTLFTDYALKKRFVWMPSGTKATYNGDGNILDFPVGTALLKTFYYNTIQPGNTTKIIETRVMIRKADGWKFYEYLWNDAQTEANLVSGDDFLNGSIVNITFTKPDGNIVNTDYRIPSDSECLACHKINEVPTPIGPKPQNLNWNYNFSSGSQNQLQKWVDQGYLQSFPSTINSVINYKDTSQPLELRARSYLDANCAHCHRDQGRCDYRAIRLGFQQTSDPTMMGVCIAADEPISPTLLKLISPGQHSKSVLWYRVNSNQENDRMPLIGRSIVHDEGAVLLQQWINSITTTCP